MKRLNRPSPGVLNFLAVSLFIAALFFLTTNGLPLIDAGLMPDLGSHKSPYVKLSRIFVLVFFLAAALMIFFYPEPARSRLLPHRFLKMGISNSVWKLSILFLFASYAWLHTVTAWTRHDAFQTRAFDLGIFSQAVWTTLHGKFLFSSIKENICLLGDHVSPLLAFLAPLYSLWESPKLLLALQAAAAGSCMVLISSISKRKLEDPLSGILFAVLYFFYYPTRAALHEDFHPEVLAEPFLILAFNFVEQKKAVPFLLSLLVAVTAKENFFGVAFILGFYAAVFKQMRVLGIFIMALSVGFFLACIFWVVPHFSGAKYLYSGSYSAVFGGDFGAAAQKILDPDRWEYVLKIYFPFLFTSFLSLPTAMLSLPILLQNVLSENAVMRSFNYHYTTGLTPFVFISCIYGLDKLRSSRNLSRFALRAILCVILAVNLLRSGPSEYFFIRSSQSQMTEHHKLIKERLRLVDPSASVLTHNGVIPQIANRFFIYQFDYLQSPTKAEQAAAYNVDLVIWDESFWEPGSHPPAQARQELLAAGYEPEFEEDGFAVFKKSSGHTARF